MEKVFTFVKKIELHIHKLVNGRQIRKTTTKNEKNIYFKL